MNIRNICCEENDTLRHVIEILERENSGIVILEDKQHVVTGIMTDGDIRRALLQGFSLDSPAYHHMNREFRRVDINAEDTAFIPDSHILYVPVLDKNGYLKNLVGFPRINNIPVSTPVLNGNEFKYISECLKTQWISSQGGFVTEFEKAFGKIHENSFGMTTTSGTTALHLALLAADVVPGDEVIVPASTFAASANTIIHAGATPVFIDIQPDTWCIDPILVSKAITPRTKAIMPVHLYGHPADMDAIIEIAAKHHLRIIEDCAESLGATYRGRPTGVFGDVACFSFFANKVITTGEGGMILCRDDSMLQRMRQLRDHGASLQRRYWHEVVGYNYRMTNIQAAIGLAQLEQLDTFLTRRSLSSKVYTQRLGRIPGLRLPDKGEYCKNIFWLFTIRVDEREFGMNRDQLMVALRERGVDSRPFFPALPHQPAFQKYTCAPYPIALDMEANGLSLPGGNAFTEAKAHTVCDILEEIVDSSIKLR